MMYVSVQNVPAPHPCDQETKKDECFQYRNDCAWCKDEKKCSNWDACKDKADDFEVPESRNKDDQCTTDKSTAWILS